MTACVGVVCCLCWATVSVGADCISGNTALLKVFAGVAGSLTYTVTAAAVKGLWL
jgi:hypothetical protein